MNYEEELKRLNEYQREAVLDESDACIVNANVGSGKTTVLISKILYLHHAKNVSYRNMIVLTFTNKAANEIKERLTGADSGVQAEDLEGFGTFHSVALHFLKNRLPVEKMGYTRDFLVIEPEEELDIALHIIQEEKLSIKYKNRLKKRLEQAMAVRTEEQMKPGYKDDLFRLVQLLREEKIRQNKMSFLDLLQNVNDLLDDSGTEPKWIIIDEVQDSDSLQLDFIDKLKRDGTRLFAVGDPNQVIYSWRGSTLNVVYALKHKYAARELSLPVNYRSSSSILEAARCFLQNGGSLTGVREPGSKIVVKNQYNPFNEACYLADKIQELHSAGVPYKEIAIFYRLQNQSQIFEDVFQKNGIPYEVSLKKTIRDIPVLNWVIKLLRFSVNPNDLSSGIYVLSNQDYGERIREKEAAKLVRGQSEKQSGLLADMQEFAARCAGIQSVDELYDYFGFDRYIKPTAATYREDKESIRTLLDIIIAYGKEKQMTFLEGLTDFLNSSALYGVNILQKDISSSTDSVKLMTLHASKGLEFSHVFITGVNYGLIPLQTKGMEEEEEERRLFFVGITRAKDYLELSYYTNPEHYRAMAGESRYIRMIPPRLIRDDAVRTTEVSLQELKKQIQAARAEGEKAEAGSGNPEAGNRMMENQETKNQETKNQEAIQRENIRRVSHKKYGIGTVLREDEMMIEAEFENYGMKEFMKAFSELEYL
ncbi:UvrD-helicase domain-containing protein [Anaerobium acetethylicum]|uniref:DNA 3'-5' helicase n=1 Tax=Anaerobium acetethylicum TaxID=1619234 RepID=A0A1D3TYD9_9FIRM|nr:UvrD-helicase domain-containing protein [Anaerobium acetethylicum]SCP99435.1 DNA helicase-2 / ATP-dependent DNA helicase PcrA [Anaerobium acetethylicum]